MQFHSLALGVIIGTLGFNDSNHPHENELTRLLYFMPLPSSGASKPLSHCGSGYTTNYIVIKSFLTGGVTEQELNFVSPIVPAYHHVIDRAIVTSRRS